MGYANARVNASGVGSGKASAKGEVHSLPKFPGFLAPLQGESLLRVAHPSAMNYIWWIIFGVLLIPAALIGVAMILYAIVNLRTTTYVITDRRIVVKTGLLSIRQSEVRIDDIRGVNLQRGLWQRIIGTGNVAIGTAATGGAEITMIGVGDPNGIVRLVNAQRRN